MDDELAKRLILEDETEEERMRYEIAEYYGLSGVYKGGTKSFSVFRDIKEDKHYKIYFTYQYDYGHTIDGWEQVKPITYTTTKWEKVNE